MKKRINLMKKPSRVVTCLLLVVVLCVTMLPLKASAVEWIPMGDPGTHEAFWGQGATIADVCNAITGNWLPMTNGQVMGYMGTVLLGQIAERSTGATVTVQVYYFQIPGQPINYMYEWTVTESSGHTHGPYKFTPNPYVTRSVEENEFSR